VKIQSSNKQNFYITTLDECTCPDFTFRDKSENRLSCECVKTFECIKCSCKHQRENLIELMNEEIKQ
jgi:predicted nucleic acid-binding Zn finger protein